MNLFRSVLVPQFRQRPQGYRKEFVLPSGRRVDGINFKKHIVKELKPNNKRARDRGMKQLDDYIKELDKAFPKTPSGKKLPWRGFLDRYK